MILGTGTDIVEVERIQKAIEKNDHFKLRVFSTVEIAYCEQKINKYESYTGRFAAKEAFFKALGSGWRGKLSFSEVSVENNELGKPSIFLSGETANAVEGSAVIHVSISHTKDFATAIVIIEKP
ncbi:MAG: holo-ACP synthase [Cytophagaceae bacterium]